MEFVYFNDWVFPICEIKIRSGKNPVKLDISHFHGTGFFVGNEGYFLSAKHVINSLDMKSVSTEIDFAAILTVTEKDRTRRATVLIESLEEHPTLDIVLGKTSHLPKPMFSSANQDAFGWEDVHCFGYPEDLIKNQEQLYIFSPQFFKGYIVRRLSKENLPSLDLSPSYELNFPIPKGVSGAPVFRIGHEKSLVGVAIGSHDSVLERYKITEYSDDKKEFTEKLVQVTQFGIAARASEFSEWTPEILKGKKLSEIF